MRIHFGAIRKNNLSTIELIYYVKSVSYVYMKSHYTIARLLTWDSSRFVGMGWKIDWPWIHQPDNPKSLYLSFGDARCPWAIEVGVCIAPRDKSVREKMDISPNQDAGVGTTEPGRYILTVCSQSFLDDPAGAEYFDGDPVKPLVMPQLDFVEIAAFVEAKLAKYQHVPTVDDPFGTDREFYEATKDWLYDTEYDEWTAYEATIACPASMLE